ncbi:Uncharacterised protein [Vibrio cholerae]|nr:Uncharacterised protein [Vibrio cholerae]CSC09961.1 Uncharacterised protein [Vibrio cholerae]CSI11675.1 Uncharacterised protein [Vibrio cholerae]
MLKENQVGFRIRVVGDDRSKSEEEDRKCDKDTSPIPYL